MARSTVLIIGTALALMGCATMAGGKAEAAASCAGAPAFAPGMKYIDGYRVITGADGDSELVPLRIEAKHIPLLNTGKILDLFDLPAAPKRGVQIVAGPPNVELPLHPAPYNEMFILISGSFTLKTAKASMEMQPGSVLLFEDVNAKVGHGALVGPCGYVSLSIAP